MTTEISPTSFYGLRAPITPPPHPSTTTSLDGMATPPHSTPVAYKLSGSKCYTSMHYERVSEMRQLGREMAGKFVGPMPVEKFLDTFLPTPTPNLPWNKTAQDAFNAVTQCRTEPEMYPPLILALKDFCPRLELVDTHAYPDPDACDLKPDIAAYNDDCSRPSDKITSFSHIEISIELKFSETDDAFQNWNPGDKTDFERDSQQGKDTKGQITSYAAAHLQMQFRQFVYSVLICGHGKQCNARLLRWDRSGAIVTEAFPLSGKQLASFFWKYNHLSPEQRGVDMTVSAPSEEDEEKARQRLNLRRKSSLVQIFVTDTDKANGVVETFIMGKPAFAFNSSATGRSTRGFVAYYPAKETVVFLKDTWRIDLDDVVKEGKIYQTLQAHDVPYIAPCLLSGDVEKYRTLTHEFVFEPWACNLGRRQLVPLVHYRLVLGVVGRVLNTFTSTSELVRAVGDAFEAHKFAWERARILHRDISVGNILMTQNGRGLLIDWDLCKHQNDLREAARRDERTGTWQFMAAKLLIAQMEGPIVHTLQDDMESFVHVMGWIALRYMKHEIPGERLASMLQNIFDYHFIIQGGAEGGTYKMAAIQNGIIPNAILKCSPGFRDLLKELTEVLAVRYERVPAEDDILIYNEAVKLRDSGVAVHDDPKAQLLLKLLKSSHAATYFEKQKHLDNSDWMLGKLREAVTSPNPARWPHNDGAFKQLVLNRKHDPGARKRKRDEDLVGDLMPKIRTPARNPASSTSSSLSGHGTLDNGSLN